MKILHIVPTYLPAHRYGGPIQSVHNLNKWLVRLGVEVTVYTTNVNGRENLGVSLGRPIDIDGVKVAYFPTNLLRGWYFSSSMSMALSENMKNFDLVHITSVFLFVSTFGARYAKKSGIPYVISPRGNLMKEPLSTSSFKKEAYINLIERKNLAGAAAIHFTSEEEKNDYIAGGFPLRRAIVIANGVDVSDRKEVSREEIELFKTTNNISAGAKIVSCLGRVSRIKGFDVLVPAIKSLKDAGENIKLLVIGGDDNKGYLGKAKKMIAEAGLQNEVIFAGMLSGHEKEVALASSDVLAQPSESESFGMAAAEAMVVGLPLVVTKGVGLSGLIGETNSGIVINKNTEELSSAIKKLISDAQLAETMGSNGKDAAKKYLSGESVAEKFIAEYNSIIKEHAKNKQKR